MSGPAVVPQMSLLDCAEPPWCERTQDMSGFILPASITSPLLDEQPSFTFSTAQNEIDFIQHSDPTGDFNLENQSEVILGEESIMFDNMNYILHTKVDVLQTPSTDVLEINRTAIVNDAYFMPVVDAEQSFMLKPSDGKAFPIKKPGYLSIFDNEEPLIKEDLEISSCSENNKGFFELRNDMEVAEEVVVTAEEPHSDSPFEYDENPFPFECVSSETPIEIKEEVCIEKQVSDCYKVSDIKVASLIDNFALDMDFEEDLILPNTSTATAAPGTIVHPQLHLDIDAAFIFSNQLLGEGLPDTPEVLKPVLKPECDFDLVSFLLASGDANNNVVQPPQLTRPPEKNLRGKGNLLLSHLKESEKNRKVTLSPSPSCELSEPIPGPSSAEEEGTRRSARKGAMKLKKLMEEGLLMTPDSSEDEEEFSPKCKRRRQSESSSTSSRRRVNSESDQSSVCDDGAKYRERRDRNNLSSKLSRQKRKVKMEQKKVELKELELKNKRLRKREEELSTLSKKVHAAWQEYLANNVKKEN